MRTTHLLHGGDPAPGDPAAVRRLVSTLRGVVHEVDRAAALVRRARPPQTSLGPSPAVPDWRPPQTSPAAHDGFWTGPGATAFAAGHEDLQQRLRTARAAYESAADALAGWVVKLDAAQAEAAALVRHAQAAPPSSPQLVALQHARDALANHARRDAQACARAIEDASRQVGHFQHSLGQDVVARLVDASHVLHTASQILGVAALALALVPVLGEAVGTLALATSAALLVVDAGLAVSGHGSWKTVALDGLDVGLGAAGRAGTHIVRNAKAARQFTASATEARHLARGFGSALPAAEARLVAGADARLVAGAGSVEEVRLLATARNVARADAAELTALARQARAETTVGAGLHAVVHDGADLSGLVRDAAAYGKLPTLELWKPDSATEWAGAAAVAADTYNEVQQWVQEATR